MTIGRMPRSSLHGALILVALATPVICHAALAFTTCEIGEPGSLFHMQASCATLQVPEDRARPQGKQIGLHIAVLRARTSTPAPDPLFFIAGGPGQAATAAYVQEASAFGRIRAHRAIVLVDQRGTGKSNPLNCPATSDSGRFPSAAKVFQQAQSCLAQLHGDLRFYTTTVAVQDLDAVRAALGYRQINLYGISYGTRVALEYLREFPRRVRSMILDGVVPADYALGPQVSWDAEQALDRIFRRCARAPACHRAFPHLHAIFERLEKRLIQHPVTVKFRNPLSGMPSSRLLTWNAVADTVRLMSYASETAALLPLLIDQASVDRDYGALMADSVLLGEQIDGSIALGMNAEVLCTEDVPFYHNGPAVWKAMRDTYVGTRPLRNLLEVCRHWPKGVMASDFKEPVVSTKPVLLISGTDDPITPPTNAAHAAKTLPNSLSILVAGQGHGNALRGCVPRLMARFLERASVKHLDTACVKQIEPFPFFTSFTGPGP